MRVFQTLCELVLVTSRAAAPGRMGGVVTEPPVHQTRLSFLFVCFYLLILPHTPHATRHTPHATIFCWQDCGKLRVQITGVMNLGTNPKGKTTAKTMEWTCQGVFSNHEGHNLLVFIISSTSCRMSSTKSRQRYKMRVLLRA